MASHQQAASHSGNPMRDFGGFKLRALLSGALLVCGIAGPSLRAATPERHEPAATLSKAQRAEAVREIERLITANYVFDSLRAPIVARLRASLAGHRYDVDDAGQFAERVNEDLAAASHDGHLYLRDDPGQYAAALAPARADDGLAGYRRAQAIRQHHGLTEMAILPGNIRYLKITGFKWVPDGTTAKAYDEAAAFLADGDAVIVDLRGNGGGESDAADYFLKTIVRPEGGFGVIANPARRKPLYLLVDGAVGSAAEAVAYAAQLERTGTIVGATTYGAANNNKLFPVAPRFMLSVSYNRPINPISGTNWEGVGVSPDIKADPLSASYAAQFDALKRLSQVPGVPADTLADYRWREAALEALLHPVKVSDAHLRARAGNFGPIELRYSEQGLRLYRPDRPKWPQGMLLWPMSAEGLFGFQDTDQIRVRLTDSALELLHPGNAEPQIFGRTAPARPIPPAAP